MREVKWTSRFKKKYKLAVKRGLNISILMNVVKNFRMIFLSNRNIKTII